MMSLIGFVVAVFSFLLGAWYVVSKIGGWPYNPGLPTTVLVVSFFSGVQLLSLGLMGEYIGRIYDEVKRRPKYIVDRTIELPARLAPSSGDAPETLRQEDVSRRRAEGS
jgi:dolichol-phosphate mannosyltransferase